MTVRTTGPSESPPRKGVYSVGYDVATAEFFRARRAPTHAAFLLPHLRPGMRLLDGGRGPGSITSDLAAIVSPAEVVGIDIEASQVDLAARQAAARGVPNARFQTADLSALPFPEQSFDAVYLHGVLEHLQNPVRALHEVRRVLRRGGVLGTRHADFGGFILEPAPAPMDQFASLFERLMLYNGAHPRAGRQQVRWLRESEFFRTEASASYDCWTRTPEEAVRCATFLARLVADSSFSSQLLAAGLADRATLQELSGGFFEWGALPGAFAAEAWGEAVAWRR